MNYNENSMKAAYRCVVLAASGDGSVSDDELETALSNTEWTENYTKLMVGVSGIFDDMMSDLFGVEPEEEEAAEEEDLVFEALTEDEVKEIVEDVATNLAKCNGVSDIKAYTSLCAAIVPEDIHNHIISVCFNVCGSDSAEWMPDKKEIRNIKYLCSEFGLNFKEEQTSYLHSLTWYTDDLLGDDLKVELVSSDYKGCEENSADAVLKLGILAAFADAEHFIAYSSLGDHWFLAACDIARIKGQKTIKVPEKIGDYLEALHEDVLCDIWKKTSYDEALTKITELDDLEPFMKAKEKVEKMYPKVLDSAIDLINEESIKDVAFKNASFLCAADEEQIVGYSKMNFFSGDTETMEINHHEEEALQYIGTQFGWDEDKLYGIQRRIEDGAMGSVYSTD